MNKKVALFDFCETLVDLQTADDFVLFILKRRRRYGISFLINVIKSRWTRKALSIFGIKLNLKLFYLSFLRGEPESLIEDLAREYAHLISERYIISDVFDELKRLRDKGVSIWIVSAGYEVYIKYFFPVYIDKVLATTLDIQNGAFTGKILGNDCYEGDKIRRILEQKQEGMKFISSYSDSISDLPLLKFTERGVVISKRKKQEWAKKNELEEIVWH